MKPYKVLLPLLVNGEHGQGDVFEHEFDSADDEKSSLDSGLLELVPREYKVIGSSEVYETKPGDTFTAALTMGQEQHLIGGDFIEVVAKKRAASSAKTSAAHDAAKEV